MSTPQILGELFTLSLSDLRTFEATVSELIAFRERTACPDAPPVPSASPVPAKPSLRQRSPMRSPKPGSLRADIHEVLRGGAGPLKRREVIARVAARRGVVVDDLFRASVGEVLNNPHDPFIRKVGYGIYAAQKEVA